CELGCVLVHLDRVLRCAQASIPLRTLRAIDPPLVHLDRVLRCAQASMLLRILRAIDPPLIHLDRVLRCAQASISGSRFSLRPRSFFWATAWPALCAVRSARSSASSAARAAARSAFAACISTLASAFFLCGPSTMIMFRPSCLGADS